MILFLLQIANCNKLDSLDNWPYSDSLNKLVLVKNESLKSLPDWTRLPNLQHLLVLKNDNVRFITGTELLKHARRIFLLNNRDVVANSIHAGYGFDWGWLPPEPSSVKVEFEHRRTIKWLKNQDFGFKAAVVYAWKKFEDGALYTKKETKGYIGGIVVNYYSPYRLYLGIGAGYGNMQNVFQDQTEKKNITFLWINNLGYQFAPYFLRKDKVSINMDLYTIFEKDDYFILPSFGLTYYHTLGFHRKTSFIRTGDSRRHIYSKRKLERIDQLPVEF